MNDGGEIVGMVDVFKFIYVIFEQINMMGIGVDNEGLVWNKFWFLFDYEIEFMVFGDGFYYYIYYICFVMFFDMFCDRINDSVVFGDLVSYVGVDLFFYSVVVFIIFEFFFSEILFVFKFKVFSGCVYCL